MNDELKGRLTKYLDHLEAAAGKAQAFAETEIPETIREYLMWLAIERFVWGAISLVGCVVVAVIAKKISRSIGSIPSADMDDVGKAAFRALTWIVCAVAFVPLSISSVQYLMSGTKVLVAPRVAIVEEMAKIVKEARK